MVWHMSIQLVIGRQVVTENDCSHRVRDLLPTPHKLEWKLLRFFLKYQSTVFALLRFLLVARFQGQAEGYVTSRPRGRFPNKKRQYR